MHFVVNITYKLGVIAILCIGAQYHSNAGQNVIKEVLLRVFYTMFLSFG